MVYTSIIDTPPSRNMNKATAREVSRLTAIATAAPEYAAASLASLHRAATARTQAELFGLVQALGLAAYVTIINGAMVATHQA